MARARHSMLQAVRGSKRFLSVRYTPSHHCTHQYEALTIEHDNQSAGFTSWRVDKDGIQAPVRSVVLCRLLLTSKIVTRGPILS